MSATPRYVWHRSSHSTGMNNCVETAGAGPGLLAVRDSKCAAGPVLLFSPAAWSAFVTDLCGVTGSEAEPSAGGCGAHDRLGRPGDLPVRQVRAGGQPEP